MGRSTPVDLDTPWPAGSEVAVWREGFRAAGRRPRPCPGPAGSGPRQVRQRHGPARQPRSRRGAGAGPRLRRGPQSRAGRDLDPLRHRRRTGLRVSSTSSSSASPRSPAAVKAEFPDVIAHAANSAAVFRDPRIPFRHGALRRRRLRARPLPGRPWRARPDAGALAALLRRRREALRRRRERRLRPHLARAGRYLGGGAAARLRRRRAARSLQQRRGADPRSTPPAGRHGLDGQRHRRPRPRDRGRAGRRGGADRPRRARRRSSPRRSPRAWRRSTTRSPAGSLARVPREPA